MEYVDEVMGYFDKKNNPDSKEFLYRLLAKWKLFLLFSALGIGIGYVVSEYSKPVFMIKSSVLVHSDPEESGAKKLFDIYQAQHKTNIQNHVEILKSYTLNRKAMENLGWKHSWYKREFLFSKGLYRNDPFSLEMHEGTNLTDIPVSIIQVDEDVYRIKVEGKAELDGNDVEIYFEDLGYFGRPFKNDFFNFTITANNKKTDTSEGYYFIFNDLDKLTLDYMERMTVSVAEKKADLIYLQIDDSEPNKGVDYLNELNWVYIQFGLIEKNKKSESTVRFIDNQLEGIVDSLQIAGQSFTNFRSRNRIVDLGREASVIVAKMEALETELSRAQIKLEYYQNLQRNLGDANQMKQVVAPSVVGITDPSLDALVAKLTDMYGKREVLSYSVQPKNPSLVILNKEIQIIQQNLDENLRSLLANSKIEVSSLSERMQKVQEQLSRMPRNEQKLVNMKRNFDLNNELYTYLLKKRAEAAIAKASNVSDSQIIDPARLATVEKTKPKMAVNLLVGLFLGFGIPLLVLILKEFFNDKIQSKAELVRKTNLSLLASVIRNKYKTSLTVFHHPRSAIAESFRNLRTSLNYVLPNHPTRIVGIHSTTPGEGKSFIAANLASIVAMNNKKVLLIDADMRKSKVNRIFGLQNKIGLSTYLISQNNTNEVIQQTKIKNLFCISSGPIPPNPAELLENGRWDQLLKEVNERFDYVFVDNAPMSIVTDGIVTGKLSDANLFVLREGFSQKRQIEFVNQISSTNRLENVSLVFNDVTDKEFYNKSKGYYYDDHSSGALGRLFRINK